MRLVLEKRAEHSLGMAILSPLIALALTVIAGGVIFALRGLDRRAVAGVKGAVFSLKGRVGRHLAPDRQPDVQAFPTVIGGGKQVVQQVRQRQRPVILWCNKRQKRLIGSGIDFGQKAVFRTEMMGDQPARRARSLADIVDGKGTYSALRQTGQPGFNQHLRANFACIPAVSGGSANHVRPPPCSIHHLQYVPPGVAAKRSWSAPY